MERAFNLLDAEKILSAGIVDMRLNLHPLIKDLKSVFTAVKNVPQPDPVLTAPPDPSDLIHSKLLHHNSPINNEHLWYSTLSINKSVHFDDGYLSFLFWSYVWGYCAWGLLAGLWGGFGFC
jgi:hypothetical protein